MWAGPIDDADLVNLAIDYRSGQLHKLELWLLMPAVRTTTLTAVLVRVAAVLHPVRTWNYPITLQLLKAQEAVLVMMKSIPLCMNL